MKNNKLPKQWCIQLTKENEKAFQPILQYINKRYDTNYGGRYNWYYGVKFGKGFYSNDAYIPNKNILTIEQFMKLSKPIEKNPLIIKRKKLNTSDSEINDYIHDIIMGNQIYNKKFDFSHFLEEIEYIFEECTSKKQHKILKKLFPNVAKSRKEKQKKLKKQEDLYKRKQILYRNQTEFCGFSSFDNMISNTEIYFGYEDEGGVRYLLVNHKFAFNLNGKWIEYPQRESKIGYVMFSTERELFNWYLG